MHQTKLQNNALFKKWLIVKSTQYIMVWGGYYLSNIGTSNVREDELNPRLRYAMVIIDDW